MTGAQRRPDRGEDYTLRYQDSPALARPPADMLGNLVAQTADSRRAELDVPRPVTLAANGPANALGLPMSADTRRDEPGCRPPGDQTLRRSGQLRGPASRPVQEAQPRVPGS